MVGPRGQGRAGQANPRHDRVLAALALQVRTRRQRAGFTVKELAARAGLSERFVGLVEAGRGNPAVTRLDDLAVALGCGMAELLVEAGAPARPPAIALLGLRGAGKTSVGKVLARRLRVPFVEVDAEVEESAGMKLAEIFGMHGEAYYRRLELQALRGILLRHQPCVLATGGGVVTHADAMELLAQHARTVWLKAPPQLHWERVLAQGDRRPMAGNPHARAELESIYAQRAPLYARADITVETQDRDIGGVAERVDEALRAGR